MRLVAFGRDLDVLREGARWRVFDVGTEGKCRPALDIEIPDEVIEQDIPLYLADLLHEYASARYPDNSVID